MLFWHCLATGRIIFGKGHSVGDSVVLIDHHSRKDLVGRSGEVIKTWEKAGCRWVKVKLNLEGKIVINTKAEVRVR